MRGRLAIGSASLLCATVVSASSALTAAEPVFVPRFAPDVLTAFQVNHPDGDDYIAPVNGAGPVKYDPAHPFIPTDPASSVQPTFRVADLNNPILKPWAKEQMKKANDEVFAGKIPYVARERCWPAGTPAFVLEPPFNITLFIDTPKEILIVHQNDQQFRHVYMNVPHSKNPKPSWTGESVGHYEGDTLIVDTIGLNDRTFVDNYRTPHTAQMHVVERFRFINGGKVLEDEISVEDPGAFNMPWKAVQRWNRTNRGPMEELPCSENNENLFNYDVKPIPMATHPDF